MEHFFLPGSIDFAADDHGALSCCIHEGLMCLVIVCETMLTISESRAISHANDTEQQAQQVAVNPRRWGWNRHEPHTCVVWSNSRLFMEPCYRWENCRKTFNSYWPPNRKSTNRTVLQNVLTCAYGFILFPLIKLSPNALFSKFKILALSVRASLLGRTDHQSHGCDYLYYMLLSTEFRSRVTHDQASAAVEADGEKCYWNICLLKSNMSNHFIGKRSKKSFLLVSLFIFSLHIPRPALISYSRSSPHHNQSFCTCFVSRC